jgi:hypothetical protein
MITYLQIVCGREININPIIPFLRNKDFNNENDRTAINKILTSTIHDCNIYDKLLSNLHLFEKSKVKNKNFVKTLRTNIIDSDRIIPMNVLSYLDGKFYS